MKILILTAATGGGHIRAANAVQKYLQESTELEVETVDTLKAVGRLLDKTVCDSYLFMARKAPYLFGSLYKRTNQDTRFAQLVPRLNALLSHALRHAVQSADPDVIFSTHPFATQMVSSLKKSGDVDVPLISLITDYGLHKAWIAPNVDSYIVACHDMVETLMEQGIPKERIHPFGIPVHGIFFRRDDKKELRKKLLLDPELSTVTFMAGSFGVSSIIDLYHDISSCTVPMQLIVITGKNQKLYDAFTEELSENSSIPTKLIYFTNEVENYMHASDLLVTKPGGLTVSEALASNLPLLVFNAIPGQEEDNAAFLSRHGMGISVGKDDSIAPVITDLLQNPQKFTEMQKNCRSFDKSDCMENIAALCQSLAEKNAARERQLIRNG